MPRVRILPDNKELEIASGETVLAASLRAGIPHTHACGGSARCSTCRVLVVEGVQACAPMNDKEKAMADRLKFTPDVRLACQMTLTGNVEVRRLSLDEEDEQLLSRSAADPTSVGSEKRIAILFSDIRGFTPFSEVLPPYDVIHVLNRYFDVMGKVIHKNSGCVDNYMGDGLMALFGVDNPQDASLHAVKAGVGMLEAMEEFKPYLQQLYGRTFEVGIGIHIGDAVVGTIGTLGAKRTTAIGDAVNLASRIESANKKIGTRLLISTDVYNETKAHINTKGPIRLVLPGKSGEYSLHEVLGLKAIPTAV
jgi:adenylate cyclase